MAKKKERIKNKTSSGFHRKSGDDFLEKNSKKDGVFITESGLQYSIIEEGESKETPDLDCFVTTHQRILLLNGKAVQDTYKNNETLEFRLKEAIEGIQEALQMMSKGSRWKLFVAPELAWGKKGTSKSIPPNSVLIVDIKLVDFY